MERLVEISRRLTEQVAHFSYRFLYDEIHWEDSLIMIKGARGVGKTTLLKQRCRAVGDTGLYVSLDQLWFNEHTIVDIADYHYKHGGRYLFLDEVHRYPRPNWQQELKNIYDSYPGYNIVFTGSSLLQLNNRIADLSRRVAVYSLPGLSFREYLKFKNIIDIPAIRLDSLLENHPKYAAEITSHVAGIIGKFEDYTKHGWYPFMIDSSLFTYYQRVGRIIETVMDIDIPSVTNIEYETQRKIKRLLLILSEQVPFQPNISKLSKDLAVSRSLLLKMIDLLSEGLITRSLFLPSLQPKAAAKPDKLFFDNPSIMYALGIKPLAGTLRETFAASMLAQAGRLFAAPVGDFILNKDIIFEVGGERKGFKQIADLPNSYILADDLEIGYGNKIPLWAIGMIY